ncbi:hypothetical protein BGX29_003235 [Mortierella sp. GBA35]|nr:hypothetical protein BGX29_003235 [Mortierella sp. GBA35]
MANTEKVIFTVDHTHNHSSQKTPPGTTTTKENTDGYHGIIDPSSWNILTSPHTIIRAEKVLPSFYKDDVTIGSQRRRASGSVVSQLINEEAFGVDLQNRQFIWYALKDLNHQASFELRISYPATSPADFELWVWTLREAQEYLPASTDLLDHFPKNTMFARVKATYTGVSYLSDGKPPSPETLPVPFNLVLERLYFMIPYQALKLAAVIAVVAIGGLGYLVPRVHRTLIEVAGKGTSSTMGKKAE